MSELDKAIELAKKECELIDMKDSNISIVEIMTPYTRYINLLWEKMNQIIENSKKNG